MFDLTDYTYFLPDDRIAQKLATPADSCKLLVFSQEKQTITDHHFADLPALLDPGTTHFVFNTSKVLKARLLLPSINGEIFFLRAQDAYTFEALVRPGKKFPVGATLTLDETDIHFTVRAVTGNGRLIACSSPILEVLDQYGQLPLPPYIAYDATHAAAYQAIFAQEPWSVAAPTASLHFTDSLLQTLYAQWATSSTLVLHVGLGTFKQVDTEDITSYSIHEEQAQVSLDIFSTLAEKRLAGHRIVGVGTTVTRTLESLPFLRVLLPEDTKNAFPDHIHQRRTTLCHDLTIDEATTVIPYRSASVSSTILFETKCYLYPGKSFRIITALITNFHLPKSSLLMLVAGFMGYHQMKACYDHALRHEYLFYSFGDAMLITRD